MRLQLLACLALASLAAGPAVAAPPSGGGGLVVEEAVEGGGGAAAGWGVGDVVLSWEQRESRGQVSTPFDLWRLEIERLPAGDLTVVGARGEAPIRTIMPQPSWQLETRPVLPPDLVGEYLEALRLEGDDRLAAAAAFARLAAEADDGGDALLSLWMRTRSAEALADAGSLDDARQVLEEATEDAALHPTALLWVLLRRAELDQRLRRPDAALSTLQQALALVPQEGLMAAAIEARLGELALALRRVDEAEALHQHALELRRCLAPGSLAEARSLHLLAGVGFRRGDLARAEQLCEAARAIVAELDPEGAFAAQLAGNLGLLARIAGRLDEAHALLTEAVALQERLVPGSPALAASLTNLATLARQRGRLEEAEALYLRALAIKEETAPDSISLSQTLLGLSNIARDRGDLAAASERLERSIDILERLAPRSSELVEALNNMALVERDRGALASAEALVDRGMAIPDAVSPDGGTAVRLLNTAGLIAMDRYELEAAARYFERCLALAGESAGAAEGRALYLTNLGIVAMWRQELGEARRLFERALELKRGVAPRSVAEVSSLTDLALVLEKLGEVTDAERHFLSALEIAEEAAPESLLVASVLTSLGRLQWRRGDLERAESTLRRALLLRRQLAPESAAVASSAHALALVVRDLGRTAEAIELLRGAVVAIEAQEGHLGGGADSRSSFRSRFYEIFLELIDLLLGAGRPEEAFLTLERSRAQGLLAMLAARDLVLSGDLPPGLERERRALAASRDRLLEELERASGGGDGARSEQLAAELAEVQRQRERVRSEVREQAPRIADLLLPGALDLAGALAVLDEGTVCLSYSVGRAHTHLFVLAAGSRSLEVLELPVGEDDLQIMVGRMRALVAVPPSAASPPAAAVAGGSALYDLLIRPAEGALAGARRLLVVPDGPLHLLPFAALVRLEDGAATYLVEQVPVHAAVSLAVYEQLRRRRSSDATTRAVVFADPPVDGIRQERAAALRGAPLDDLPAARQEAEAIGRLLGDRAELVVGAAATEERVRRVAGPLRFLHFATHAQADPRAPLDSALLLAAPASGDSGDDGLLQAWEVIEGLRLDAGLVTLSGCDTGLGGEIAGEGMIGLVRAFHHAGARAVLASLWSVSDASTGELMSQFYRRITEGAAPDQALRGAQLELLRGETGAGGESDPRDRPARELAHPYFWAAFQLFGDWR